MDVISYALAKKHTNEKIAEQKLKVAKVEHELNDLKGVLQQVNINHEAKQKVSGYGIVTLKDPIERGLKVFRLILGCKVSKKKLHSKTR